MRFSDSFECRKNRAMSTEMMYPKAALLIELQVPINERLSSRVAESHGIVTCFLFLSSRAPLLMSVSPVLAISLPPLASPVSAVSLVLTVSLPLLAYPVVYFYPVARLSHPD